MKNQDSHSIDLETLHKIEDRIQERVDSGYTVPCGWLFRKLKFFFHQTLPIDISLDLARNTSRFAGADILDDPESPIITHIIVNPDTLSSHDLISLRRSLSTRAGKMPHLVNLEWVKDSWSNKTLLDEESKFCTPLSLSSFCAFHAFDLRFSIHWLIYLTEYVCRR